jgi:cell division protein FtsL
VNRRSRLGVAGVVAIAVLSTAIGVRHVTDRREVVKVGYALSSATAELRRLEEDNRRLRLERSVLTSPARIERLAAGLGMARPGADQIRIVRDPAVATRGAVAEPRP